MSGEYYQDNTKLDNANVRVFPSVIWCVLQQKQPETTFIIIKLITRNSCDKSPSPAVGFDG